MGLLGSIGKALGGAAKGALGMGGGKGLLGGAVSGAIDAFGGGSARGSGAPTASKAIEAPSLASKESGGFGAKRFKAKRALAGRR